MRTISLYEEVRDAVGRVIASGSEEPLRHFGLDDLLVSPQLIERNAAFAVAEAQGRAGATTPVVSRIALAGLALPDSTSYGLSLGESSGDSLTHCGLLARHGEQDVLVSAGPHACLLDAQSCEFAPSPLDPGYLTVCAYDATRGSRLEIAGAHLVESRGRLACAAEILGACEAMLADAIGYANTREQFGSPLSGFQAVAHALAWAATEVHQLRALLDVSLQTDAMRTPDRVLAAATKSMAGRVGRQVAQITLQVTGGMGFTWEYSHNRLHRRVLALDAVGGSAEALNFELGRWLREGAGGEGDYPAVISLPDVAEPGVH